MAIPVLMPRQGQSVETCILGQWFKKPGDEISEGDLLFSYETDKASFEEEAKTRGILLDVFFGEGDEVPVLVNVAVIGQKGESAEPFRPGVSGPTVIKAPAEVKKEPALPEIAILETTSEGRVKISPLAKKMAETMGVNLTAINGTGPRGRIIARDVQAAKPTSIGTDSVAPKTVSGDDFEIRSIPNIRKLIATAMHQSLQNSAQLTHHLSADARKMMAIRKKFKKEFEEGKRSQNITINDLVCLAVIRALKKFPQANTHYLGDKMKWFKKVHLGLAVDTERGLMVPAIKNADDLSVEGLSSQLQQIAAACRKGNIAPDLLSPEAATFTVSNLGNYGVEMFTPVINLPQTAILGVCTIIPRPKDLGDGVYGFVPMIGLSLTYNHQALDGGEATRFLAEIKNQIETINY